MKIGILALQGAVEPHQVKLQQLGAEPVQVRTAKELNEVSALILPGGESTTFLNLIHKNKIWDELKAFCSAKPTWGICAGAIVLAKNVFGPQQESLGVIDIDIQRNGYGRQLDSFIGEVQPSEFLLDKTPQEGVFIRAPKISRCGTQVKPLFFWDGEPVMVEEKNVLASAFHPEMSAGLDIHRYFLAKI